MSFGKFMRNRGGAGISLSRPETAERFNALIARQNELMYSYDYVIENLSDRETAARLDELQRVSRTDIGKMCETVFSNGRTPPNGTDIEPSDINLGSNDDEMIERLHNLEQVYNYMLDDELKLRHQMRSNAILEAVKGNSSRRLAVIAPIRDRRERSPESSPTN